MFQVLEVQDLRVLSCRFSGEQSKQDFEEFSAWANKRINQIVDPRLLLYLGDYEGYEDFEAFGADLHADIKYKDASSRIAFVGDQNWLKAAALMAKPFTDGKIRSFSTENADDARAWVKSLSSES